MASHQQWVQWDCRLPVPGVGSVMARSGNFRRVVMAVSDLVEADAPAQVLALILSADGSVSERALRLLDGFGAFSLLGVSRQRFIELARTCSRNIAPGLCERSWLSDDDIAQSEALLDAVREPARRILVCHLAAAAMADDGLVTHGARLVLDHALAHWRIDPAMLSPANWTGRAD
jgi:hypothetical protein